MSPQSFSLFFVFAVLNLRGFAVSDAVNVVASDSAENLGKVSPLSPLPGSAVVDSPPVFTPAVGSAFLNLLSSFPEDLEISEYCSELLLVFGQRYVTYVDCLVPAARPVKACQNCFSSYGSLVEVYTNISSDQMGPGNVSCRDSLLRSDRLMLVYQLFSSLQHIWEHSACSSCVSKGYQSLSNDTLYFLDVLNQTIACFDKYKQGNLTDLCSNCKSSYKSLNVLYGRKELNQTLCIDLEDSMNMTRKLWSKNFNCSLPREETVPVIAVSSFMLFLPIIFYLSSFLHSEQKKRKLIHPKRAKSSTSLMNIQDKQS
ncbi:osteopetrosis-associated transmembrane protein 1 [Austrofundulus limnaeus]|uniref:Osteopetrosis-associated transmembrane protein 1 n=1 Tax=Austrofundulus limnaeus TaxID=52670 RepID=A0A2I4BCJ2_AUSLI|nr:PREDICTED: osteopetrosis-associated transmembrane protein 1 [Austrofundulus limnaeus]